MMDELMRTRLPAVEKAGFEAAAAREGLKLSEWVRQACREKMEAEIGVTVGLPAGLEVPQRNGDGDGHGNFEF